MIGMLASPSIFKAVAQNACDGPRQPTGSEGYQAACQNQYAIDGKIEVICEGKYRNFEKRKYCYVTQHL